MKIYNTDKIEIYANKDSVFSNRDVSSQHEERMLIKDAVMETLMCDNFGKREREYWALHKRGMSNKQIAEKLGITESSCRSLKRRATKKIDKLSNTLKEKFSK